MDILSLGNAVKTVMREHVSHQEFKENALSALNENDQIAVVRMIQNCTHSTLEEARSQLQAWGDDCIREEKIRKIKWTLILLAEIALAVLLCAIGRYALAGIIMLLTVISGCKCFSAHGYKKRLLEVWNDRANEENSIVNHLDEMCYIKKKNSFFQCSTKGKAFVALGLICTAALFYVYVVRYPVYKKVVYILNNSASYNEVKDVDEKFKGMEADEIVSEVHSVIESIDNRSDNMLKVAYMTCDLAQNEMITPEGAYELMDRILPLLEVGNMLTDDRDRDEIFVLMDAINGGLRKRIEAEIGKEYAQGGIRNVAHLDAAMAEVVKKYYSGSVDTQSVIEAYVRYGNMDAFLKALGNHADRDILFECLKVSEDRNVKAAAAKAIGAQYNTLTEILPFLADLRECGVTAADCYPDGVVIDWDLMELNRYAVDGLDQLPERWLPVIRTEKEEKVEGKRVDDSKRSYGDNFESVWPDSYKSNDALGKDAFTIKLDTQILSQMPAEMIPETIEEIDGILIQDTLYPRVSTIRETSTPRLSGNTQSTKQTDYPVYCAIQRMAVYSFENPGELHLLAYHKKEARDPSLHNSYSNIKDFCLAKPDAAWAEENYGIIVDALKANGWDFTKVEASSEEGEEYRMDMFVQLLLTLE